MAKLTASQKLKIYRRTLEKMLAENSPQVAVQKALIAKLEASK